ncbi:MAG: phosphoglycerate kinase [Alphaproteobacteria bacterium]|nr:MAG: phosphoglycerate kinase [Alphaproteobacteria bacterium]
MLYENVLIRVDLNTKDPDDPKFQVIDETIRFYLKHSRKVILATHYKNPRPSSRGAERRSDPEWMATAPPGLRHDEFSIQFLIPPLQKQFNIPIEFLIDLKRPTSNNQLFLLENIRLFYGETDNDPAFAEKLSEMAEFYVNEAFASSHRQHASLDKILDYLPSTLGFSHAKELHMLELILSRIQRPILAVIGGVKWESKRHIIEKLQAVCDDVFLGDGMLQTGALDISKERQEDLAQRVAKAGTVIWNGALGKIEDKPYDAGSLWFNDLLQSVVSEKSVIIGGGDLTKFLAPDYATYSSTAGGALLQFIVEFLTIRKTL